MTDSCESQLPHRPSLLTDLLFCPRTAVIGVVASLLLLSLPWTYALFGLDRFDVLSRLNCEQGDIDIYSGRVRRTRHLWFNQGPGAH